MTTQRALEQLDHQRLQQAAQWFAVFAGGEVSRQEHSDFELWLQSKDNQQAWGFVDGVSQQFAGIRHSEHRSEALNALGSPEKSRQARRDTLKLLSLLPMAGLLGWSSFKYTELGPRVQAQFADYATEIGKIEHYTLADNSRVSLNTASAINVHYGQYLRLIDLVRGEVLIDTGKDPRHFEVNTGVARLRALGTRFSVRQLDDNRVQLSVFDGRVAIYREKNGQKNRPIEQFAEQIVSAGQQVMINRDTIENLAPTNDKHINWQRGLLLADDITLAEFVEQLARYRSGYLGVSPQVAQLRIMGTFPLDDTDKILAMVANSLPVEVNSITPWWVSIEPRQP